MLVEAKVLVKGDMVGSSHEVLYTDVPLSFWGGVNPETGIVCDVHHPLYGQNLTDKILILPSGRGSCTASQVLLELILNQKAPHAIILQEMDTIVCTGIIIAQELFSTSHRHIPTILHLPNGDDYSQLSNVTHLDLIPTPEKSNFYNITTPNDCDSDGAAIMGVSPIISNTSNHTTVTGGSSIMVLTEEEECVFNGTKSHSKAEQLAMRILVRMGNLVGAKKLINVQQAHIDGCTYIGPGGLKFVRTLVELGGRVKIPTTLNSISADTQQNLGIDNEQDAREVAKEYLKLNCQPTFTCAPYLLSSGKPNLGDDIIWGESNAVVYANSILGARTDKYADYFDICAALVGKVPEWGVHLPRNRIPKTIIDVSSIITDTGSDGSLLFPILGWLCGKHSQGQIPLIVGMELLGKNIHSDDWKSFCAAYGTTGTSPLFHVAHQTPEAKCPKTIESWKQNIMKNISSMVTLTKRDYQNAIASLDKLYDVKDTTKIDLIALGNPHLSLSELQQLSQLTLNQKKYTDTRLIATLSRQIYQEANKLGYIEPLQQFGMEFIHDTCWCMLITPPIIPKNKNSIILTNSGKYAHYGPGLTNRSNFRFASTQHCIQAAITGTYISKKFHSSSTNFLNFTSSNTTIPCGTNVRAKHFSRLFLQFAHKIKL